uniref:Uncharacterized protein n=1 Tax=Pararge aegeria TaxID=116150 RepID=S4NGN9_9NEOP
MPTEFRIIKKKKLFTFRKDKKIWATMHRSNRLASNQSWSKSPQTHFYYYSSHNKFVQKQIKKQQSVKKITQ